MKCVIIAYETTITHLSLITYFFLTFLNFIFWGRGTYCQTAFFVKWRRKKNGQSKSESRQKHNTNIPQNFTQEVILNFAALRSDSLAVSVR